jgi:hypothetical protein
MKNIFPSIQGKLSNYLWEHFYNKLSSMRTWSSAGRVPGFNNFRWISFGFPWNFDATVSMTTQAAPWCQQEKHNAKYLGANLH